MWRVPCSSGLQPLVSLVGHMTYNIDDNTCEPLFNGYLTDLVPVIGLFFFNLVSLFQNWVLKSAIGYTFNLEHTVLYIGSQIPDLAGTQLYDVSHSRL